jgi:hypothetical protein
MLSLLNTTFTNAVRKGFTLVGSLLSKLKARSTYFENKNCTKATLEDLDDVNLLEKASIITTPTAYSDGKLHSVKPVQTLGDEEVTNGDFDTDSGWSKGTGINISGGSANFTGFSGQYLSQNVLTSGYTYYLSFNVSDYTSGSLTVFGGAGNNISSLFNANSIGNYTGYFKAGGVNNEIYFGSDFTGSIDNVSIKEVTDADFDFQRGSAATRVNSQGLIENVQILSGNLVQNEDFSEIGTEEVLNGNFSQQGSEEVTNGGFDSDTGWTKETGWTISDGKANANVLGTQAIYQSGITLNKWYKVTYTISDYVSGDIRLRVGTTSTPTVRSSNGTFTEYLYATGTNQVRISPFTSGFIGSIDNVSVKEVGQNWDFSDGATITDNGVRILSDGTYQSAAQYNILTVGKQYKVQYEIVENNSGALKIQTSLGIIPIPSTVGIHTVYGEALQTFLTIERSGACDITITNISVKEVGQNWTFGTGASMGDGVVIVDGTGGNYDNIIYQDTNVSFANKKVKIKFDVLNYVSGKMRVSAGNSAVTPHVEANGSYEFISNVSAGNDILYFINYQVPFVGSIDNVSVIEVTDDTDLPRIDYTDGCGSLLLEPQSTNLLPYSEDFSQWTKSVSGITLEDGYISPDGSNNAYKMTAPSNGAYIHQTITLSNEGTTSIYVKSDNLNGEFYLVTADGSLRAQTVTDEWTRVSLTSTPSSSSFRVWLRIENAGDSVYIWGAQLEQLSYSTSYIPTNGSTATRLADVCNNAGSSDLINSTEGVLYAEVAALSDSLNYRFISISDGTNNNRIYLNYSNASNQIQVSILVGGVQSYGATHNLSSSIAYNKIAVKWKLNDFSLYVNGVEVSTSNSNITFSANTLNKINFSNETATIFDFEGKVKALAVYKEALTNDELEGLTGEGYDTFNALALANNYTII